jgi:DHA1 family tetracycline resistance protein-like MFS transporter
MTPFKAKLVVSCILIFLTAAGLSLYLPVLAPLFLGTAAQAVVGPATSLQTRQLLFAAAVAVPQLFSALGAPLFGALSDRYGRKRCLVLALGGAALAMGFCALSIVLHRGAMLIVALALLGLADGIGVIVQAGLLEESPRERHAADIGKLTAFGVLGMVSGPVIGGLSSDERVSRFSSYHVPFLLTSVLFVVAIGIVAVWYADGARVEPGSRPRGRGYFTELLDTIRPLRIRRFVYLFFLLQVVIACFYVRMPVLMQQNNGGPLNIGIYGAYIASLVALTCIAIVPRIPASTPIRTSMTGSFLLLAAAGALLLQQPSESRLWLSGLPFAMGGGIIYCLSLARITEWTEPSDQGKLAGLTVSISALAFLLAGAASATGSEVVSSALIPVVAAIGICVSASVGPLRGGSPEPSPAPVA